jgi:pimeloyl-ACP methyl ester carboxylesterase
MYPDIFTTEPVFLTTENPWERFRIGPGPGSYAAHNANPGTQFPVEHYENFVRQNVPRWTSTDAPTIAAYTALVDRVCPCVILFHSQAGQFGYKVAQARPEKIRALIAVEPAGIGDAQQVSKLAGIPVLVLYGDFIEQDPRWPTIRSNGIAFTDAVNKAGGKVEVVDLPKVGIKGNSHMIMMDKNSDEVAAYIQTWLERQGLFR